MAGGRRQPEDDEDQTAHFVLGLVWGWVLIGYACGWAVAVGCVLLVIAIKARLR